MIKVRGKDDEGTSDSWLIENANRKQTIVFNLDEQIIKEHRKYFEFTVKSKDIVLRNTL